MILSKKASKKPCVDQDLIHEIERVKLQMDTAYTNFQDAMDPDLIDCYIYESNAAWKKYRFLLRLAKSMHT